MSAWSPDPARLVEVLNAFLQADDDCKRKLIEAEAAILLHSDTERRLRQESAERAQDGTKDGAALAQYLTACADRLSAMSKGLAERRGKDRAEQSPAHAAAMLDELQALVSADGSDTDLLNLRRQIALCGQLLNVVPKGANGPLWAALQVTMGDALQRRGALTGDPNVLRQAEEAYRAALEEQTRQRAPMDWAGTQNNLGAVLQSLGALTGDFAVLRQAEAAYCATLLEWTRERAPMNWAAAQNNLGNALLSLGDLAGNAAVLRQAEVAYRAALLERSRERAPMNWATTQNNLGNALLSVGTLTGDAAVLRQAEAAYRAALLERTRERAPMGWAMTQTNLGNVLARLGALTGDAAALCQAVAAYRAALLEQPRERAPMNWAATQTNLGNVLLSLGDLTGDAAALRQAEAAYCAALLEQTRERAPMHWATTQNDLGNVLLSLGELTGDAAALRQAEAAYCAALSERTRERAPMDWAGTQNNLGTVLQRLGELTGDVALLRRAEAAYRAALHERTRERAPMNWAQTQNNLGIVLESLGDLSGDAALLRQAEAAYRAALLEQTRESAPMEWAATQNNLGIVLQSLGDLTGDAAVLRQAEAAYCAALLERSRERAPMDWATTQNDLGNTLQRLGALTGDAAVLRQADAAYRAALLEQTRERAPMNWATTQNNLGTVLHRLGELIGDVAVLRDAEAAYRAALRERTRERAPMNWAQTQNNLGNTLASLGGLTGDAAVLRHAEEAYRAALLEQTGERAPMDWAGTQYNLGTVLQRLGTLTGDAAVLRQAEAAYRAALEFWQLSGADDQSQMAASTLSRLLLRQRRYTDGSAIIEPALDRSNAALIDAGRSRDGVAQAVTRVGGLHALLSLCRLRQKAPDRFAALAAAESGRARLLADALALDTVRLEEISDPEIQNTVRQAALRLNELRDRVGYRPGGNRTSGDKRSPSVLTSEERTRLQAELRLAMDSYVSFCLTHGLIPPPDSLNLAEMWTTVPLRGALVLPVLADAEAFALVLGDAAQAIDVVELPMLNNDVVTAHLSGADGWFGVYYERWRKHGTDAASKAAASQASERWHQQLTATRAWLWDCLLGPVHAHLRDVARLESNAPVVLLPPGLLGVLPLHAAGPGPDGRDFGEYWTVSYAPSIRALLTCRQRLAEREDSPAKLLAVIDPSSDKRLPGARQEVPMLRDHFAHAEQVILQDTDAMLEVVMRHLPTATHVHASTHGWHDMRDPLQSGLHLADEALRLEMLRHTRLRRARLVFLSACESGRADIRRLAEEFIGLPVGLIQAGATCVIATLWPIGDAVAFLLATKFYELFFDETGAERAPPVVALRDAVVWLRAVTFGQLRQLFPEVQEVANGPVLLLTVRFDQANEELTLPLGPDDDCPFAATEHWAAFTVTGL